MIIKIVENAIDSLHMTIDFIEKLIKSSKKNENRYWKLTIIFLHNAIEL